MPSKLETYLDAAAAAFAARHQAEQALGMIARQASGPASLAARLLAMRRYLRVGPVKMQTNWSWTEAEMRARQNEEPGVTLYAEAEKVRVNFASANPGYTLTLSPPRSLERQVVLWIRNETVRIAGPRLVKSAEGELNKSAYPARPDAASTRAFSTFLKDTRVDPEPTNAAPGTSDHGRGIAVDFVVMRGSDVVADIKKAEIETRWHPGGWHQKLAEACEGTKLRGPLPNPYEPWHWWLEPQS